MGNGEKVGSLDTLMISEAFDSYILLNIHTLKVKKNIKIQPIHLTSLMLDAACNSWATGTTLHCRYDGEFSIIKDT